MGLDVSIICRNFRDDRVIPRFSRYLSDYLGWNLASKPAKGFALYYLSGYFEWMLIKREFRGAKIAAYFTHREEKPVGNAKAQLFDSVAAKVDLRIATAGIYADQLVKYGDTAQIYPPVERSKFTIPNKKNKNLFAGFSGYTYPNKRKGEGLAVALVDSKIGKKVSWKASGRGWCVPTRMYPWSEMDNFYQSLDILVITAMVEGVPMPPLEALACGVSVVVPRGVGLLDELPDTNGIHRYERGNKKALVAAFQDAVEARAGVNRGDLRAVTKPYSILAWCEQHKHNFEELLS